MGAQHAELLRTGPLDKPTHCSCCLFWKPDLINYGLDTRLHIYLRVLEWDPADIEQSASSVWACPGGRSEKL